MFECAKLLIIFLLCAFFEHFFSERCTYLHNPFLEHKFIWFQRYEYALVRLEPVDYI